MEKGNWFKKVLLGLLIASFVIGSVTFLMVNRLKTNGLEIKYEAAENGLALKKYNGTSADKTLRIPDTAADENGRQQPVTALGEFALSNSAYLEELHLGANVAEIHVWAISNCERLSKITVDENNPHFTARDGVLYSRDMRTLLVYPNMAYYAFETNEKGESVRDEDKNRVVRESAENGVFTVPEGVESIGENAFYKCGRLTSIVFAASVREVREKAFFKCKGLKALTLGAGFETIGVDAFAFCDNVEGEIRIPSGVKSIGQYAFFSNSSKVTGVLVDARKETVTLGENWLPNKKGSRGKAVDCRFIENGEGA